MGGGGAAAAQASELAPAPSAGCQRVLARVEPSGPVLVSVLSPRMVYSMTEWPRMRAAAETLGFGVVAWWSPQVSEQEATEAAARAGWPMTVLSRTSVVPEECTAWVGVPNHFPYTRVRLQGRTHAWPIWGVLPDQRWLESLQRRVRVLEEGEVAP
jgi:hypothetical protein